MQQIAGGPDGQAKLLGAFGKHLTVPGEGWIVIRPNSEVLSPDAPEDGHDWRVLSAREVRQQSGKLKRIARHARPQGSGANGSHALRCSGPVRE